MLGALCLPFASDPAERASEETAELLRSTLLGLRAQTETLQRGAPGSAAEAEPVVVLGASTGLLSALTVPVVPLVDEAAGMPPLDAEAAKALTSSESAAKAESAYQQRCFAAVVEGRRDAFHKLVRRRVQCLRERARGADVTAELQQLDAALGAMPSLGALPPPAGVAAEDVAALGGGELAAAPAAPPLPAEVEALLARRMHLRRHLAPLHTYLSGVSGAHASHGRALFHEASWIAPCSVSVYEALEPSPLPALRRSEVEMRDLLSAATTALRGSGGRGGASEFSSGGFSSVAEPVGGGVSSQLGSSSTSQNPGSSDESHGTSRGSHASPRRHAHMTPAEVDRLHASQTEAMAFVLSGPTAADLSRAAAAARDAEAATAAEAARRELGVARARLDLARRRQAELDQSAFTCALAVGDDVFVITAPTTEEGSGGDAAAAAAAAAGPPAQLGTIINLEGVASYLVLLDDPNGNPTSKILARALLRAVRPKAEAAAAAELSAAQAAMDVASGWASTDRSSEAATVAAKRRRPIDDRARKLRPSAEETAAAVGATPRKHRPTASAEEAVAALGATPRKHRPTASAEEVAAALGAAPLGRDGDASARASRVEPEGTLDESFNMQPKLPRNVVEWNLLATQADTGAGGGAAAGLGSSILPGGVSAHPGAPTACASSSSRQVLRSSGYLRLVRQSAAPEEDQLTQQAWLAQQPPAGALLGVLLGCLREPTAQVAARRLQALLRTIGAAEAAAESDLRVEAAREAKEAKRKADEAIAKQLAAAGRDPADAGASAYGSPSRGRAGASATGASPSRPPASATAAADAADAAVAVAMEAAASSSGMPFGWIEPSPLHVREAVLASTWAGVSSEMPSAPKHPHRPRSPPRAHGYAFRDAPPVAAVVARRTVVAPRAKAVAAAVAEAAAAGAGPPSAHVDGGAGARLDTDTELLTTALQFASAAAPDDEGAEGERSFRRGDGTAEDEGESEAAAGRAGGAGGSDGASAHSSTAGAPAAAASSAAAQALGRLWQLRLLEMRALRMRILHHLNFGEACVRHAAIDEAILQAAAAQASPLALRGAPIGVGVRFEGFEGDGPSADALAASVEWDDLEFETNNDLPSPNLTARSLHQRGSAGAVASAVETAGDESKASVTGGAAPPGAAPSELRALSAPHLLGVGTPVVLSSSGDRILYERANARLAALEAGVARRASALIELHVQATLAREAATPEVVARALARGLVRATQGASAASVGAGASAEDPAAKRARSQVDVLEVLLCLLRAEHRFLCSRTALLRQHMALLPHAATPCQRAAFWQRLQGIVELQLVAAPPLPPPPVLIPPRRSIIRSLEHRNAEMAATRRAAHAGIRLVSAVSWAYGIASDAQAHSLIKEASVVARLCSLAAAAEAVGEAVGVAVEPLSGSGAAHTGADEASTSAVAVQDDAGLEGNAPRRRRPSCMLQVGTLPRRSLPSASLPPSLPAESAVLSAGASHGVTSPALGSSSTLSERERKDQAAVAYTRLLSGGFVASVLGFHSALEHCTRRLRETPELSRGLSYTALRLATVRQAERNLKQLNDAVEAIRFGGESVTEYADTGLLGDADALALAISEIARGAAAPPSAVGGAAAEAPPDLGGAGASAGATLKPQGYQARLKTLARAHVLSEALAALHTDLMETRRLSMIHFIQKAAATPTVVYGLGRMGGAVTGAMRISGRRIAGQSCFQQPQSGGARSSGERSYTASLAGSRGGAPLCRQGTGSTVSSGSKGGESTAYGGGESTYGGASGGYRQCTPASCAATSQYAASTYAASTYGGEGDSEQTGGRAGARRRPSSDAGLSDSDSEVGGPDDDVGSRAGGWGASSAGGSTLGPLPSGRSASLAGSRGGAPLCRQGTGSTVTSSVSSGSKASKDGKDNSASSSKSPPQLRQVALVLNLPAISAPLTNRARPPTIGKMGQQLSALAPAPPYGSRYFPPAVGSHGGAGGGGGVGGGGGGGGGGGAARSTAREERLAFCAPPMEPAKAEDPMEDSKALAACRVCALAEAEAALCDFAPRDSAWWLEVLVGPSFHTTMSELNTALRLQRAQRAALAVITAHNACAINASLAAIAEAEEKAARAAAAAEAAEASLVPSELTLGNTPMPMAPGAVVNVTLGAGAAGATSGSAVGAGAGGAGVTAGAATAPNGNAAAEEGEAVGARDDALATDDGRCAVPIQRLCVRPAYQGVIHVEDVSPWGDLTHAIIEQLCRALTTIPTAESCMLWLTTDVLEKAARATLLTSWGDVSTKLRQAPPAPSEALIAQKRLRQTKHELLGHYCHQLYQTLRQPAARVATAALCASAAQLVAPLLPSAPPPARLPYGTVLSPFIVCDDPVAVLAALKSNSGSKSDSKYGSTSPSRREPTSVGKKKTSFSDVAPPPASVSSPGSSPSSKHTESVASAERSEARKAAVEAALEARSSLLSADATLESLWSLPDPQYALRLLRAEPLQDSKGKELKGDAVTGALEAHAEAAAALLGLVPLLQLRASLTSLDGPPIVFRVGLAGGGSSVGAGRSAIKTGFENLLHVGGGGNAEADEAGKAAGKIEVSSVVVVTPPKHAAPQLAPHSLADATRTERLALGAALWEIEEVTAPMLPCKCPLRKLPDPTAKQVAADRPTSASGGRGKRDKQELLEGGAAPKGSDEDAVLPVRWLRLRSHALLLQLQLSLYRTHALLNTAEGVADAAVLLRALWRLHAITRDCAAPPHTPPAALGPRGIDPSASPSGDVLEVTWRPLELRAPERLPQWLHAADPALAAGTGGADPAAWDSSGADGARGFLCDSFDPSSIIPVEGARTAALRIHNAVSIVAKELLRLSTAGWAALAKQHELIEKQVRQLAQGGHADVTSTPPPPAMHTAPIGGHRGAIGRLDAPDLVPPCNAAMDGIGDVRRWVFEEAWDARGASPTLAPPPNADAIFGPNGGVVAPGARDVVLSGAAAALAASTPEWASVADYEAVPPLDPLALCVAQVTWLQLELQIDSRRAWLLRAFRQRCPVYSEAEAVALYDQRVLAQSHPPYVPSALPPLAVRAHRLALSDAWCEREELLRRLSSQRLFLERAAAGAMAVADAHFENVGGRTLHTHISAAVRSTVVLAQRAEAARAKKSGQPQDYTLYARAVGLVLSGAAAGLCLEAYNPHRSPVSALAAELFGSLAEPTSGAHSGVHSGGATGGSSAGGSGALAASASSAPLTVSTMAGGAAGLTALVSRGAFPPQIHTQVEAALQRLAEEIAELDREKNKLLASGGSTAGEPDPHTAHADFRGQLGGTGAGAGIGAGGPQGDEGGGGDLSSQEMEVLNSVLGAYEGRAASQGPEPSQMKSAILKAMLGVERPEVHQSTSRVLANARTVVGALEDAADRADAAGGSLSLWLGGGGGGGGGVPGGGGDEAPVAARFVTICAAVSPEAQEAKRRMQRWANVDALHAFHQGDDLCLSVADKCLPPLPSAHVREHRRLVALAALGLWRAAGVSSTKLPDVDRPTEVALRASALNLSRGFASAEVRLELKEAAEAAVHVERNSAERVRVGKEAELASLVVRRLTLRGLLREQEYRLAMEVRLHRYETKREAMLRMVQSGSLPIELKVSTLGDARAEEELHELRTEAEQIKQLLLRVRMAAAFRQLRRERVQSREERSAGAKAARDAPLLSELAASERRQALLSSKLAETQKAFARHSSEHEALTKKHQQMKRATGTLESFLEEAGEPTRFQDGKLVEVVEGVMERAARRAAAKSRAVAGGPSATAAGESSLIDPTLEAAVLKGLRAKESDKLIRQLKQDVSALETTLSPRVRAAANQASSRPLTPRAVGASATASCASLGLASDAGGLLPSATIPPMQPPQPAAASLTPNDMGSLMPTSASASITMPMPPEAPETAPDPAPGTAPPANSRVTTPAQGASRASTPRGGQRLSGAGVGSSVLGGGSSAFGCSSVLCGSGSGKGLSSTFLAGSVGAGGLPPDTADCRLAADPIAQGIVATQLYGCRPPTSARSARPPTSARAGSSAVPSAHGFGAPGAVPSAEAGPMFSPCGSGAWDGAWDPNPPHSAPSSPRHARVKGPAAAHAAAAAAIAAATTGRPVTAPFSKLLAPSARLVLEGTEKALRSRVKQRAAAVDQVLVRPAGAYEPPAAAAALPWATEEEHDPN